MKYRYLLVATICGMLLTGCSDVSQNSNMDENGTISVEDTEVTVDTETENETDDSNTTDENALVENDNSDGADNTEDNLENSSTEWSVENNLKKGLKTAIDCDKQYDANIKSEEAALDALAKYGDMQREKYSNPEVTEIEMKMQEEFEIPAVNLGEMDLETAKDIYRGCEYIFTTYPYLKGTVSDITLGNIDATEALAITQEVEFITNGDGCPMVVKREVILSANTFLKREKLLEECKRRSDNGYWPKNSDPSKIIVHELGHHLLDDYIAGKYDIRGFYITKDRYEDYIVSQNDQLASFQNTANEIMDAAYKKWSKNNKGSEEDFRASISQYAIGTQSDGGVSLTETIAEAIADIYCNGENAAEASKLIEEELVAREKETIRE